MYEYIVILRTAEKSYSIKVKANIAEEASLKALRILYRKGYKKDDIIDIAIKKMKWY